jgi:hypothetical protein
MLLFIFLNFLCTLQKYVEERLNHFCNGHVDDGGENGLCSLLPAHKNPAKRCALKIILKLMLCSQIKFVLIRLTLQEEILVHTNIELN